MPVVAFAATDICFMGRAKASVAFMTRVSSVRPDCRTRHPPTRNVPLCLDFTSSISRSNRITLLYPWYTLGFRSLLGALVPSLYCFLPIFFPSPARHAGFLHPFFVYCVRILSEHRLLRAAHIVHFALGVPTIIMQWGGLYD